MYVLLSSKNNVLYDHYLQLNKTPRKAAGEEKKKKMN